MGHNMASSATPRQDDFFTRMVHLSVLLGQCVPRFGLGNPVTNALSTDFPTDDFDRFGKRRGVFSSR